MNRDSAPHPPEDSSEPGSRPGSKPSMAWVPPTAEELQKLLPEYEIVKMLGLGGMGAVYMGRQTSLDRPVAIKILSATLEDADPSFAERFKNEAKAMAKLNHPGIVAVYDFGEAEGGLLYIVMEYVEGTDVARMIASSGRLHTEHAMAITAHVCDALAYAHERGIIHRDIKPANIMVGFDGVVKVADFGLAKVTSSNASTGLTQSNVVMGTLHYMAPEALILGTAVDHRADIYAVGVMLYQMLTAKLPKGLFKLPSALVPGIDPRYDGVIAKAIMEERDARYQSAAQLRRDLDGIITQPVARVEAPAPGGAPASVPAALPTLARPQRPAPQPRRAPPPPAVGAPPRKASGRAGMAWAAAAVLAIAAGTWFLFSKRSSPPARVATEPSAPMPLKKSAPSAVTTAPKPSDAKKSLNTPASPAARPPQVAPQPMPVQTLPAPKIETSHSMLAARTGVPFPDLPLLDPKAATTPVSKIVTWEIPFQTEEFQGNQNKEFGGFSTGRLSAYMVQEDERSGMVRFTAQDARLGRPGLVITSVAFRFHTPDDEKASTKSPITVSHQGKTLGTLKGAGRRKWHDVRLSAADFPRTMQPITLRVTCGQDAVYIHNHRSGAAAHLVVNVQTTETPAAQGFTAAQAAELRSRVANYQKARSSRLKEVVDAHVAALTGELDAASRAQQREDTAAIRAAIGQMEQIAAQVREMQTQATITPLPRMAAAAIPVARWEQASLGFARQSAEIEHSLITTLTKSLGGVQSAFADAGNNIAAETLHAYAAQLTAAFADESSPPLAAGSSAQPVRAEPRALLAATKDQPWVNSLGMKFVPVPGTKVLFCVHETRRRDYAQFASANPSASGVWSEHWGAKHAISDKPDHPVIRVSRHDAEHFCKWLSALEKRTYRLPTDGEWSFACGLGDLEDPHKNTDELSSADTRRFPWGHAWPPPAGAGNYSDGARLRSGSADPIISGYEDGHDYTAPVMSFAPNALGIFDLGGNAWEWCSGGWNGTEADGICRGASYRGERKAELLSSYRDRFAPGELGISTGFRCVVEIAAGP